MLKDIDAHCNCFIELTLHPISAIDISKVQSSAIPKEYTKHFPSIMSWNKSSRHNSLSLSDAAPRQWSFIESFFTLPGTDQRTKIATSLSYIIQNTDISSSKAYLLWSIVVLQIFLKQNKYVSVDMINPINVPGNHKQFHQIINLHLPFWCVLNKG